ncbi:hypothetical protein ABBQ38_009085 [Trebouxia sp. C0009 RCD-2024]
MIPHLLQVDQAQAAGIAFPVMTTSDGRPILKYSDLMQKGRVFDADAVSEESLAAASAARVRAERLNALQAQTASAGAFSAPAAAASSAAAKAAEGSDDEEGFLHASAVGSLPDHLRRSVSQDSDSDFHVSRQEEQEHEAAESAHKAQQDPRRDKQADYKPGQASRSSLTNVLLLMTMLIKQITTAKLCAVDAKE